MKIKNEVELLRIITVLYYKQLEFISLNICGKSEYVFNLPSSVPKNHAVMISLPCKKYYSDEMSTVQLIILHHDICNNRRHRLD